MKKRFKVKKRTSKKIFKKGTRIHNKNSIPTTQMRGGIRL